MRRKVQRSELQLLGITCMLIAARFVLSIILLTVTNSCVVVFLFFFVFFFVQVHPRPMCVFVGRGQGEIVILKMHYVEFNLVCF